MGGMTRTDGRLDYQALNDTIRYTMWSVFRVEPGRLGEDRAAAAQQASDFIAALDGKGVVVRGVYDLSGLRADADYMIWWHAEEIEPVQAAYADLRRDTALGRASVPVWSQVALHRPAEFNKSHIPAFLAGEEPKRYLCVYPFVRSYEWYLLPDEERRRMLAEHGMAAREYKDVRANTVPAFALGDYVFAAGQLASDFKTGLAPEARRDPAFPYYGSDIKLQTRFIMESLKRTFAAAGSSLDKIVKAQVFLTDLKHFAGFDEVWRQYFAVPPPRTTVGTSGLLVKDTLIEIDLIGVR